MMDILPVESKSIDRNEVLERLARMKRELAKKEKKLERFKRAQRARAHVKQKLREQALLEDGGQSPSLKDDSETLHQECSQALSNQQSTCGTSGTHSSENDSLREDNIPGEVTPVGARNHKSCRPFLTRLGQGNSQSLPSNFNGNFKSSKSTSGKTLNFGLETFRKKGCKQNSLKGPSDSSCFVDSAETVKPEKEYDKEVPIKPCKITISPDLLEDFPITNKPKKLSKSCENVFDNSLYLTPDPNTCNSEKSNIQKILTSTASDLQDVKLKLDFDEDNVLENCESTYKTSRLSCSLHKKKEHYSETITSNTKPHPESRHCGSGRQNSKPQCDKSVSFSQLPLPERVQSLSTKRKSCEIEHRRDHKRHKAHFRKDDSCASDHLYDDNNKQTKLARSKFEGDVMQKRVNCSIDKLNVQEPDSNVLLVDQDSVSIVSDSLSPEHSQSILKHADFVSGKVQKTTENRNHSKKIQDKDIPSEHSVTNQESKASKEVSSSGSWQRKPKQKSRVKKVLPKKSESPSQAPEDSRDQFLDFTELDVIPFSQFQYSDCLFSNVDILSGTGSGRKGRRSHFGMLIQRRSPRLSTGLKNIVGDDVMSEETISTTSGTQDTNSSSSQLPFPLSDHCKKPGRGPRKSKKGIMISSVFQFIIDEARRVQETREFVLPIHIFNKKLQKRLVGSVMCNGASVKSVSNVSQTDVQQLVKSENIRKEKETLNTAESKKCTQEKNTKLTAASSKSMLKISVKIEDASVNELTECRNLSLLNEMNVFDTARDDSEPQTVMSTPKLNQRSSLTPKHEPYRFTTPKLPPSHMSTPKHEPDLFTTPKNQIRRHKLDLPTSDLIMSPSLFPSQEDKEESILFCSPRSATKASPLGVADLPEDGNCVFDDNEDIFNTETATEEPMSKDIFTKDTTTEEPSEGYSEQEMTLKTVCTFKTGKSEAVISVLCGVLHTAGSLVDFVVTLSASSLGIWSMEDSLWTNELDWILPGDCEAKKAWLMPSENKVVVLVSGSSAKVPVLVSVFVYDWLSGDSTRFNLPLSVSLACPMSDGICCPLTDRQIAVFYRQANMTGGQKLTLNSTFTTTVDDISLEGLDGHLSSVSPIQDVSQAVVGLTVQSVIHIWNHESGLLLQSVDISTCCPSGERLASVYSEQGFLILTVINAKGGNPASLIALNPTTSVSAEVLQFEHIQSWKGVRSSAVYEDFLLASDKGDCLSLWDTCSGQLLVNLPNLRSDCLAVDPSKEQIFSGQEDGCVHIYQLS